MTLIADVLQCSPWEAYHLVVGLILGLAFGFVGALLFTVVVDQGAGRHADEVVQSRLWL